MPDPQRPSDRTSAEREADHAGLARLSDTLVPALVAKLNGSGLGELEVREGDWRVRLRRPAGATAAVRRDRPRAPGVHHGPQPAARQPAAATPGHPMGHDPNRVAATSPTVGIFRAVAPAGQRVRSGDRIAVVDLLGIPQDVVAPIDGIVVEVLVETGDAVEYGEDVAIIVEPVVARDHERGADVADGEG